MGDDLLPILFQMTIAIGCEAVLVVFLAFRVQSLEGEVRELARKGGKP